MKSWKEEISNMRESTEDWNFDFNDSDWKIKKGQEESYEEMSADDYYNYCIMVINYAKNHSIKEWFEYINEDNELYEDLDKKRLSFIKRIYNDAKNNYMNLIDNGLGTQDWIDELKEKGLISNIRYVCHQQIIRFKVDVMI